ncbi:hypothetical protein BS50DRAFT_674866 [Corynespora cassiicola Philippines]|uniref:Uncharacterized protein n=1 Tax=Corynespora cassiicola Philippines TaxID=1448308 RepID=A0A2T2NYL7_CORCC|nr:hypothetical protein BS50DRAFT_674866 [Corynespora cassiicola Philippines]
MPQSTSAQIPVSDDPPPYIQAPASNSSQGNGKSVQHDCFVIHETRIYSPDNPTRTRYQLSQPVLRGQAKVVAVEKFIFRIQNDVDPENEAADKKDGNGKGIKKFLDDPCESDASDDTKRTAREDSSSHEASKELDHVKQSMSPKESIYLKALGEQTVEPRRKSFSMLDVPPSPPRSSPGGPRIKYRRAHIYDIKPTWFQVVGYAVAFEGIEKKCFKEAYLHRWPLRKSWKVKFEDNVEWKCEPGEGLRGALKGHLPSRHGASVAWVWLNAKGKIMALEVEEAIEEGEIVAGTKGSPTKTRLEIKTHLEDKDLDFLVTAWVGRVAFQATELADPMTWEKWKKIASTKNGQGKLGFYFG